MKWRCLGSHPHDALELNSCISIFDVAIKLIINKDLIFKMKRRQVLDGDERRAAGSYEALLCSWQCRQLLIIAVDSSVESAFVGPTLMYSKHVIDSAPFTDRPVLLSRITHSAEMKQNS